MASWEDVRAQAPELSEVVQVSLVEVAGDRLVITSWHEGRGVLRVARS